ncbi:MAG: hypothetical protein U9Q04_04385 [Campylobacterota bacterium]|nr:hypothetical protein [Campylobacterota bacterium]
MENNEPSLEKIEDYNNKESNEKRTTVKLVILLLVIVGLVYGVIKLSFDDSGEYVGTPEKPGINTTKTY